MTITYYQIAWFFLVAVLLIVYAILDGFDLGSGFWYLFAKNDKEQIIILNTIRPFWDGNEVWLLTGGGALFAAFPPVYATVFTGFYLALMLVLVGLIFRAVGLDFRDKIDSLRWKQSFGMAFALGSLLPALLFGVAVGNLVRGLPMDVQGNYTGTFFDLLNPYSLLVGVTGLLMLITHAGLYQLLKSQSTLAPLLQKGVKKTGWTFFALTILMTLWSVFIYHRNAFYLPLLLGLLAIFMELVIFHYHAREERLKAFMASCVTIALIMSATGALLFPAMVPAPLFLGEGLTIFNSSSSEKTLKIMLVLALMGVPLVLVYTTYLYKVFSGKETEARPLH